MIATRRLFLPGTLGLARPSGRDNLHMTAAVTHSVERRTGQHGDVAVIQHGFSLQSLPRNRNPLRLRCEWFSDASGMATAGEGDRGRASLAGRLRPGGAHTYWDPCGDALA